MGTPLVKNLFEEKLYYFHTRGHGKAAAKTNSFYDVLGEPNLEESDLGTRWGGGTHNINTKKTFSGAFLLDANASCMEVGDEMVYFKISCGIDEKVIHIYHHYHGFANK